MKKILAADDNPDNVELLKDILEQMGHQVIKATDGEIALAAARSELPDLIILDVNMPGLSGFEVCTELKAGEATANIPVIMLTALTDVEARVEGLSTGADDYLTKPYSPRELMARVNTRLRLKATTDDLRETKELIRATFERFVAAPVVDQLLRDPSRVQLGGKLQNVTVLFADLEGFTSLSELTPPQELLSVLNKYHTFIVKIIQRYGGTVDKFLGDGVMALYNTPLEQSDHTARAVKSVLYIEDEIHHFHEDVEPQYRIKINFGIHTGSAVVGNVGTTDIMDFTAVGDAVNVAARLQGLASGGQILISEAVYREVEDFVIAREIGPQQVKGRSEPVITYEISNVLLDR